MDIVNERSNWLTTVSFIDNEGNPVTPTDADYRIDDVGSLTNIRPTTVIDVPLSESMQIKWESSDTEIVHEWNPFELRRMTVYWRYLDSDQEQQEGNEQYLLQIRNLPGVPDPDTLTT